MSIFSKFLGRKDEVDDIIEENKQLSRKKENLRVAYKELQEQYDDIRQKYIQILEEKAEGFDQYLKYQDLYRETYTQNKEYKKEIGELKMQIKALENNQSKKRGRPKKNEDSKE